MCFWTCHSYCPKECCFNPFHCSSVCQTFCAPECRDKCCAPGARKLGKLQLNLYKHHVEPDDRSQLDTLPLDTSKTVSGIGDIAGSNPMSEYISKGQRDKEALQLKKSKAMQAMSNILINPYNSCPNFCIKICAPGLCGPECCQRSASTYPNMDQRVLPATTIGNPSSAYLTRLSLKKPAPIHSKFFAPPINQNQTSFSQSVAKLEDHMSAAAKIRDAQKNAIAMPKFSPAPYAIPEEHKDAVNIILKAQQKAKPIVTLEGSRKTLQPKHLYIHIHNDKNKAPKHKVESIIFSAMLDKLPQKYADATSLIREAQTQQKIEQIVKVPYAPNNPPKEHIEAMSHTLEVQSAAVQNAALIKKVASSAPVSVPEKDMDAIKQALNSRMMDSDTNSSVPSQVLLKNILGVHSNDSNDIYSSALYEPAAVAKEHQDTEGPILAAHQENIEITRSKGSVAPAMIPVKHKEALNQVLEAHRATDNILQSAISLAPTAPPIEHKEAISQAQDMNEKNTAATQTVASRMPNNGKPSGLTASQALLVDTAPQIPPKEHVAAIKHILQMQDHLVHQNLASDIVPSSPLRPAENVLEAMKHPAHISIDPAVYQETANQIIKLGQKFVENTPNVNYQANYMPLKASFSNDLTHSNFEKTTFCPPICRSSCIDQCPNQCCSFRKKTNNS